MLVKTEFLKGGNLFLCFPMVLSTRQLKIFSKINKDLLKLEPFFNLSPFSLIDTKLSESLSFIFRQISFFGLTNKSFYFSNIYFIFLLSMSSEIDINFIFLIEIFLLFNKYIFYI